MHCHCTTCRKMHGTVFGSSALVETSGFHIVDGEDRLSTYESSPGKKRRFCATCGAQIFARYDDEPETTILRIGLFDGDPGVRSEGHIWVSDKPAWYEQGVEDHEGFAAGRADTSNLLEKALDVQFAPRGRQPGELAVDSHRVWSQGRHPLELPGIPAEADERVARWTNRLVRVDANVDGLCPGEGAESQTQDEGEQAEGARHA